MKNNSEMDFKSRIIEPRKSQLFSMDGYFVWCGSAVADNNGKYHLFASVWKKDQTFLSWLTQAKIIRAVSNNPEGPFEFVEELAVLNQQEWSKKSAQNPTVVQIDNKFYMYYVGITYPDDAAFIPKKTANHPARFAQKIGVAVADDPAGPWTVSKSNPILEAGEAGCWDDTFVNNPSVVKVCDGLYHMIYKSLARKQNKLLIGLATSNSPTGPFLREGSSSVSSYYIEDPFVWQESDKFYLIAKDMSGEVVGKHKGILMVSNNCIDWKLAENPLAWDLTVNWEDAPSEELKHMERPQLLIQDGKPICFYTAVGDPCNDTYNLARRIR